ncbi:hypothetical protein G7Y89_g3179 [Cudoniella acicularis]|uniref:Uncharacterized protein n=1 Tax=Cudoniella acicularis TaxID=354080 RepID=A0A8H4RTZ3_9HELO|nr:hypothetical protein G7Y89_g3179 [Cudoniella acicularis]
MFRLLRLSIVKMAGRWYNATISGPSTTIARALLITPGVRQNHIPQLIPRLTTFWEPTIKATNIPMWHWTPAQNAQWLVAILPAYLHYTPSAALSIVKTAEMNFGTHKCLYLWTEEKWIAILGKDHGGAMHELLWGLRLQELDWPKQFLRQHGFADEVGKNQIEC